MEKLSEIVRRVHARLTKDGREIVSPVSMEPPVKYRRQPTMESRIRDAVRSEMFAAKAAQAGFETPEEADDFEIEDDPLDPSTPYERYFDPLPVEPKEAPDPPRAEPPPTPEVDGEAS